MIISDKLHIEEMKLLNEYMDSDAEMSLMEFATLHGSDDLKAFYKAREKERIQAEKQGWIIN